MPLSALSSLLVKGLFRNFIDFGTFFSVCICVGVHACACFCMYMHVFTHVRGEQRLTSSIFLNHFLPYFEIRPLTDPGGHQLG